MTVQEEVTEILSAMQDIRKEMRNLETEVNQQVLKRLVGSEVVVRDRDGMRLDGMLTTDEDKFVIFNNRGARVNVSPFEVETINPKARPIIIWVDFRL